MRSLIWKEWQENFKWAVVPALLLLGPLGLSGMPPLMHRIYLFYVSLVAGLFGAVLGFLQVFPEARGDKRSLLLHRPLSRSQIFWGKVLAGGGLYLLALGVPFAALVGLAATPGHVAEPFQGAMTLPWLADALTGLVYYFAGMLTAQREARWYGSRCLGLAAGVVASILVWTLPEFGHALAALGLLGGVVAVAAWGSFVAGGAYEPQPRLAKASLAVTLLAGLCAVGFTLKVFLGTQLEAPFEYFYRVDRQGRVLTAVNAGGKLESLTDLDGQLPPEFRGKRLDYHALDEASAPTARGPSPRTRSYRNHARFFVEFENDSKPGNQTWWYVAAEGRLLGYDEKSRQYLGSIGPDGFVPPGEQPRERFEGELAHFSVLYSSWVADYLAFPGGVYAVDFHTRTVRKLLTPAAGETVLWASEWEDQQRKESLAFAGTDRAVYAVDEAGSRVFSASLALDPEAYRIRIAGRLEDPRRYWVWYEPAWYLGLAAIETMPAYVLEYDAAGNEISRRAVPPRPGTARSLQPPLPVVQPSVVQALFGLVTPPAETVVLVGTTRGLVSEVRESHGTEMWPLLQFLFVMGQYFLPGLRWVPSAHAGLVVGFAGLMLLSAVVSALTCFLVLRRHGFSRARSHGWALAGLLFGPAGVLLLLALQEWPARIPCASCGRPRRVDRDQCEHCGAPHAAPAPDGTEIFEEAAANLQVI